MRNIFIRLNKFIVEVLEEGNVNEFLGDIPEQIRSRFFRDMDMLEKGMSGTWLKSLPGTDKLYEFRQQDEKTWYRILAFMSKNPNKGQPKLVLCAHGITKDQNKLHKKEFKKAEKLKKEYAANLLKEKKKN